MDLSNFANALQNSGIGTQISITTDSGTDEYMMVTPIGTTAQIWIKTSGNGAGPQQFNNSMTGILYNINRPPHSTVRVL